MFIPGRNCAPKDYEAVNKLQDGYMITPLSQWGKKVVLAPFKSDPTVNMNKSPAEQVITMHAAQYYSYGVELMKVNRPHKSDWSHVAGRDVVIAADLDKAGRAYAEKAAKLCHDAGAREVSELRFPAHLVVQGGVPVPRDGQIPKGWDLADALDEGWTPEHVDPHAAIEAHARKAAKDHCIEDPHKTVSHRSNY